MILNIIVAALICAVIYYLKKIYTANLNILSIIKKINNKQIGTSCGSELSPIGFSYEEHLDETLDDFTMPRMEDRAKINSLEFMDTYSEDETL